MFDSDKWLVLVILAFLIFFLAVIFAPTEKTKRYNACVKEAENVIDCQNLLIN